MTTAPFAVLATTREVLDLPGIGPHLLAPWELRRLDAIRVPARREDVLAARLLLRLCAARLTGRPPAATGLAQRCLECGRDGHGRPYLPGHPGLGLSLSHADGLVAAAAGPGATGVDVEPSGRRPGPLRVLRRLLPEAELREAADHPDPGPALLRAWVRAEARFKAGPPEPEAVRHLTEWTDHRRAAVAAVVSTGRPALLPPAALLGAPPTAGREAPPTAVREAPPASVTETPPATLREGPVTGRRG
ncbi:4'-phosphopantetheinyl transferase superfamily protein [Streptomyces sp. NPDC085460]|uniref:4'-phosphopantetheinyl transferase superfamily protein n=1 Tax=Streptomyces sp. NPDC085460 TaxID=3365723 RepID=UPI0037D95AFB